MSCHLTSCHVLSYLVMSRLVTSCQIMSRHVMSCHVTSCHVMSSHLTSSHVLSYHVMSRLVMSRHLARESCSGKFLPSSLNSSIIGGGVAPTRFSNPWPCAGIRLGATLSLWRRAHCERARVAPCTFLRAGHRFAWQAAGIVRFGSMSGACPRAVSAALCRGDWVPGRVARAHDLTHCDLRFAWQVWDFGCIDVLGKARDGGSAWQAQCARSAKSLDFVAPCDKARVRACVGRCEIVAGAGNPWICVWELGADVSWNAAAGCVGRVGRSALCRGTQRQAVTMGVGRLARAARAALCHEDCCWACRVGGADQGMVWVAPCHQDC